MANYCTQSDIEMTHGERNIIVWSDLNNDRNSIIIKNRINWAAELATEYINSRMIMRRYTLPLSATPIIIKHMASLLAGILLHDGRPMIENMRDQCSGKRKEFRRLLRELLSGQLRLIHPTSGEVIESNCKDFPMTEKQGDEEYGTSGENCYTIPGSGMCSTKWCCPTCRCHSCICQSLTISQCW